MDRKVHFIKKNRAMAWPSVTMLTGDEEGTGPGPIPARGTMVSLDLLGEKIVLTWGQFHEPKFSLNSSEVEQNLLSERKTRENFHLKFREISAG